MNVFEDLIDELKEADLLEQTVTEESVPITRRTVSENAEAEQVSENPLAQIESDAKANEEIFETEKFLKQLEADEQMERGIPVPSPPIQYVELEDSGGSKLELGTGTEAPEVNVRLRQPLSELEYLRKRAIEEVSSLQMVDHIFTSVERGQMKIMARPYDDFEVKKVLHSFLHVSGEINSQEHAQAEFQLMQETETWYSVLSNRDRHISVENLRYCCENSRPPLSPPALFALARFYRNSPFTQVISNKFDLIVTRLFSSDVEFERRELVFTRTELIEHLTELYLEWESLPPEDDVDEKELKDLVERFEGFMAQAHSATCFGDLIESDFFGEFRAFKRGTNENFYSPTVAAAAIQCNIEVGNRYLELLEQEQQESGVADLEAKYGVLHDKLISNATSKTVQLVAILGELRNKPRIPDVCDSAAPEPLVQNTKSEQKPEKNVPDNGQNKVGRFNWIKGVNRFVLLGGVFAVILSTGLYLWVEMSEGPMKKSPEVIQLDLRNMDFGDHVVSARISNEALFAISSPVWNEAPREKKEQAIRKMILTGKDKGYRKVHILDDQGNLLAAGTENNIEIK